VTPSISEWLQQFGLHNQSTNTTFLANVADAAGDYHVFYTDQFR
jgi:hypothetical protein